MHGQECVETHAHCLAWANLDKARSMQRNAHVHGLCPSLRIRTIDKGDSRLLSAGMEIDDWKYEVSNTDLKSNARILSMRLPSLFSFLCLSFILSSPYYFVFVGSLHLRCDLKNTTIFNEGFQTCSDMLPTCFSLVSLFPPLAWTWSLNNLRLYYCLRMNKCRAARTNRLKLIIIHY